MRFIDEAKIRIAAGHGGPGCVSFRRETFVPRGGPDGGDGGRGGSVIFVANAQLGTLQDFKFKRIYQAPNGMPGSSSHKTGRDGKDIIIEVPVGTVIKKVYRPESLESPESEAEPVSPDSALSSTPNSTPNSAPNFAKDSITYETLIDLIEDGQKWVACKGGRGGKGNSHFATATHQAPKFAQPGEEGESLEVVLELKLLADVAIIGFPNAGKSTLISRISAAHPKVADYPFTTLTPNLGVVSLPERKSFVVADIPGLVEGAHRGRGLGHRFLKHIERTQLFVHLLDGTKLLEDVTRPDESELQPDEFKSDELKSNDNSESTLNSALDLLIGRYQAIRKELELFNENLLHKPEIVVLNKVDVLESDPVLVEKARVALRQRIASIRGTHPIPNEPFVISGVSGQGIQELLFAIYEELISQTRSSHLKETPVELPDDDHLRNRSERIKG